MEKADNLLETRKKKMQALQSQGMDLFSNNWKVTHSVQAVMDLVDADDPSVLAENEPALSLAGRLMAMNKFGKSTFIRFRDRTGLMQAYVRQDKLGKSVYEFFKQLDVGDFVGLRGGMFQTKTGEWTLLVEALQLLTKATRPLPEKFHGLKDPEKRYRQRYLDLIMNTETQTIFKKRSQAIQAIRTFFLQRDFLEVETPMMQAIPGGAEAKPFITHHNALDMDLYLRIAPELYLKRLVVGGLERVFEINRNFRNEGISTRHNPEFTMLEFYQAYVDYTFLMDLTEALFREVVKAVTGSLCLEYQGQTIDFSQNWPRLPLLAALREIGGLSPQALTDRSALLAEADSRGIAVNPAESFGKLLTRLFDHLVEPKLIQPTFIVGYPVEVSPLSRVNPDQPGIVDRFELFIAGCEIANGFSELNDPVDQKARFEDQVAAKASGDEEAHHMDDDYIEALEYGLPPTAGEGIGIDRLIMLLTDSASIREVILFPHMKPER